MQQFKALMGVFVCVVVLLIVATRRQFLPLIKSKLAIVCSKNYERGDESSARPRTAHEYTSAIQKNGDELWKTPFTTSELHYVINGEGDGLVSSRDSRYLNFIRSLIAHPAQKSNRRVPKSTHNALSQLVDKRLRGKRNGFFVECGANDGQLLSNTVYLETERQWTGLLVEANRRLVKQLLNLNRQAYVFGGCLSPLKRPATLAFKSAGGQGGLRDLLGVLDSHITIHKSFESLDHVYCVPLADLLDALGVKHVDFLSLDVQGAELEILKTVDFQAIRIDVIVVEAFTPESVVNLTKFFNETGLYRLVGKVSSMDLMAERIDLQ